MNAAGDQYCYFDDGNGKWTSGNTLTNFGGGKCPFSSVGALALMPGQQKMVFFNDTGDKYSYYTDSNAVFTPAAPVSQFGGKCPFAAIGAITAFPGTDKLLVINKQGTEYAYYNDKNGTWEGDIPLSRFGNGKFPWVPIGGDQPSPPPPPPPSENAIYYRVENFVFNAPDLYQNPRNYHDFMVDFTKCTVREMTVRTGSGQACEGSGPPQAPGSSNGLRSPVGSEV